MNSIFQKIRWISINSIKYSMNLDIWWILFTYRERSTPQTLLVSREVLGRTLVTQSIVGSRCSRLLKCKQIKNQWGFVQFTPCLLGFLKLANSKQIEEMLLLSFIHGFITEQEFGVLYEAYHAFRNGLYKGLNWGIIVKLPEEVYVG